MALTLASIKSIAIAEVTAALTDNNASPGYDFKPTAAEGGKVEYVAEEKSGGPVVRKPDPASVESLAEAITKVVYRVLTELARVETDVGGTYGSGIIEGKGTGKIV